MVKIVAVVMMGLMFLAQNALAQEAKDPLDEAMAQNPARFEARMVDVVAGFGGPGGLTLAGIEDHIALERAGARASAIRRFLAMDLDADGAVAREELAVTQRAASAATRGRMERQFLAADRDGSGTVDAAEIAADGQAAGLRALDDADADLLRALMRLDADQDGAVTAAEIGAAVERAEAAG